MIDQTDVQKLQQELEDLKAMQLSGSLTEQRVWGVMQKASTLLDQAEDSPLKGCVEVIFHLLSSIWTNMRNKAKLAEMRNALSS